MPELDEIVEKTEISRPRRFFNNLSEAAINLDHKVAGATFGLGKLAAVYVANQDEGKLQALYSALYQGGYTAVAGSILTGTCTYLTRRHHSTKTGRAISVLAPTILTMGLTYILHSVVGTARPELTTALNLPLALGGFYVWMRKTMAQYDLNSPTPTYQPTTSPQTIKTHSSQN